MGQRSAEPIQLPDHQAVAGFDELQHLGQPGPMAAAALAHADSSRTRSGGRTLSAEYRGSTPLTTKLATRCAKVLVFPDPAPPMTSSGSA
jgi:hypothetical protein